MQKNHGEFMRDGIKVVTSDSIKHRLGIYCPRKKPQNSDLSSAFFMSS